MKTVYLIDDDPVFTLLVEKMIHTIDGSLIVHSFGDGELAMDQLKLLEKDGEGLPDLIFLDLNMPVMDGWEFLEDYILLYPKIDKKILLYILSSSVSPADIQRSKQYSMVADFLIKPISSDQLERIVSGTW